MLRVRLQKAGGHQIKRELEEIGRETEVGETEVKQEVLIDEVNHPNMIGETNPLDLLETETETETESKEYKKR